MYKKAVENGEYKVIKLFTSTSSQTYLMNICEKDVIVKINNKAICDVSANEINVHTSLNELITPFHFTKILEHAYMYIYGKDDPFKPTSPRRLLTSVMFIKYVPDLLLFINILATLSYDESLSILMQLICILSLAWTKVGFIHGALHQENCGIVKCDDRLILEYDIYCNKYIVPTKGNKLVILDYGHSQLSSLTSMPQFKYSPHALLPRIYQSINIDFNDLLDILYSMNSLNNTQVLKCLSTIEGNMKSTLYYELLCSRYSYGLHMNKNIIEIMVKKIIETDIEYHLLTEPDEYTDQDYSRVAEYFNRLYKKNNATFLQEVQHLIIDDHEVVRIMRSKIYYDLMDLSIDYKLVSLIELNRMYYYYLNSMYDYIHPHLKPNKKSSVFVIKSLKND